MSPYYQDDPKRPKLRLKLRPERFSILKRWSLLVLHVRSGAYTDDGVEGVAEHPTGAAIEALDVVPVSCFAEVVLDQPHVTPIVQPVPDGDGFGREATV